MSLQRTTRILFFSFAIVLFVGQDVVSHIIRHDQVANLKEALYAVGCIDVVSISGLIGVVILRHHNFVETNTV